ncbi:MAG: S-methyl-5-thioribose-1-phosphate isomerase [Chloroflexota bacterium]
MSQLTVRGSIENGIVAPVEWLPDGTLRLVDQTILPLRLEYILCRDVDTLADSIRTLKVRGAPSIGVAAGYGLCLAAANSNAADVSSLLDDVQQAASSLAATRPTAVNLAWALEEVLQAARAAAQTGSIDAVKQAIHTAALRLDLENQDANKRMGLAGAELFHNGMNIITHCNAGPLAAGGIGSALGVIYTAHSQGKSLHVWVDETRPLLQGARLTTWELQQWGVPCTLVADNMAASLMAAGKVDAVLVGADRIAANGDTANKVGTYGLAVLAHAHGIPFYVAAPTSTFDLSCPAGSDIVIEQRHADEITHHGGKLYAPDGVAVYNPAFDVTPNRLISAIIAESGISRAPYGESLKQAWTAGRSVEERAISKEYFHARP